MPQGELRKESKSVRCRTREASAAQRLRPSRAAFTYAGGRVELATFDGNGVGAQLAPSACECIVGHTETGRALS